MLYFDRVDVSEEIYVNKTSASEECDICHYWYFLNYSFKLIIAVSLAYLAKMRLKTLCKMMI